MPEIKTAPSAQPLNRETQRNNLTTQLLHNSFLALTPAQRADAKLVARIGEKAEAKANELLNDHTPRAPDNILSLT